MDARYILIEAKPKFSRSRHFPELILDGAEIGTNWDSKLSIIISMEIHEFECTRELKKKRETNVDLK